MKALILRRNMSMQQFSEVRAHPRPQDMQPPFLLLVKGSEAEFVLEESQQNCQMSKGRRKINVFYSVILTKWVKIDYQMGPNILHPMVNGRSVRVQRYQQCFWDILHVHKVVFRVFSLFWGHFPGYPRYLGLMYNKCLCAAAFSM